MEKISEVLLPHIQKGLYHCCEWKIVHKGKEHTGKLGYRDIESTYKCSFYKPLISENLIN